MASKTLQIVIDAQNNASKEFGRLKRDLKGLSKSYSFEMGVIKKASKWAAIGMGALATGAVALATKSAFSAARIEELSFVLTSMGKANKISKESIDKTVKSLRGMNIAHKQALQVTALFMQSQLKLTDAVKLATAAKDLAVIAGLDSSEATETLTSAITKQSPMLLRQFGIVKGLDQIYGEYAKKNKIAVANLTEQQKKQAFLNTILEQGKKVTGTYDAAMNSVSKRYRSLTGRIIPDFIAKVGEAFKPSLNVLVTTFSDNLSKLSDWFDKNKEAVSDFGKKLGEWVNTQVVDAINKIKEWYQSVGGAKGIRQGFINFKNTLTTQVIPTIKKIVDWVKETIKFIVKHKKGIIILIGTYEALKAVMFAGGVISSLYSFSRAITGSEGMILAVKGIISIITSPVGLTVILVALATVTIVKAIKAWDNLKDTQDAVKGSMKKLGAQIDDIQKKVGSLSTKRANDQLQKSIDKTKELRKEAERLADLGFWGSLWEGIKINRDKISDNYKFKKRATGGSVTKDKQYMVGENGPEMFVPSTSGTIVKKADNSSRTENIYNFNFAGAIIENKNSLIKEIKASISREQELHRLGAI